jgi:cytochrome c-type biogenesis protein CcsB
MKIIPLKNDPNNAWYVPLDMSLMQKDTTSSKLAMRYLMSVAKSKESNSYGLALDNLNALKKFQRATSKKIVPSETMVNMEIRYNKMNIFKNTMYSYFVLGLILLVIYFIRVFITPTENTDKKFKKISMPFILLIGVIFIYHGVGIGMRWYISGHAPWSNGYEAVVFISWVAMIAGFIFSRKNGAVLAGTAILSFFILFVTELNLMDPEITPLQPVLKSYWLMIHVAIITGSYGFLGLGAILGFLNQIMYIFRTSVNGKRITKQINEITAISELTITIGLFMLTIGTFLGGIWANESWGRYWGWDPKETWALVSVLVYAILLHLRYIPGLASKFTFNLVSFWSYGAIIFTFFGVNFYLVGLHSYAQGEGLAEVPNWIYYTVVCFAVFSFISWWRNRSYAKGLLEK